MGLPKPIFCFFGQERSAMSRRQQAEAAAARTAEPILAALGLEIVEVSLTGPGRAPVLRVVVDHPTGGVTVDELQEASAAMETALEIADVIPGRYRLEVSSPGIDRPWKRLEDFERHVGERATLKLFAPLPDGRRHLAGRVLGVEGGAVRVAPDREEPVSVDYSNIASARPEIDWAALLRGRKGAPGGRQGEQP
jgi:ribosome maturation factor RimP